MTRFFLAGGTGRPTEDTLLYQYTMTMPLLHTITHKHTCALGQHAWRGYEVEGVGLGLKRHGSCGLPWRIGEGQAVWGKTALGGARGSEWKEGVERL